jgi:hypothetical protein
MFILTYHKNRFSVRPTRVCKNNFIFKSIKHKPYIYTVLLKWRLKISKKCIQSFGT